MGMEDPPIEIPLQWTSLQIEDPRFNYNAANWAVNPASVLGKDDGRDGDRYMAVANTGRLSSPGELGFLVRPFDWSASVFADFVDGKDAEGKPLPRDQESFCRTVRLYDHGNPAGAMQKRARDLVYENFSGPANSQMYVNPHSDMQNVLRAAIDHVPFDYYVAQQNEATGTANDNNFQDLLGVTGWETFLTEGWYDCVTNTTRTVLRKKLNRDYKTFLGDVYGEWESGWYSAGNANQIFAGGGHPAVSVGKPLYEIDRKMLYAFSMDSFSDRQQLFLYVLQAETLSSMVGGEARWLAGGRAVALVWRDPYPVGYKRTLDINTGNMTETYSPGTWYDRSGNGQVSAWTLVNGSSASSRLAGFHDHKVLFFKQLDN